MITIKPAPGRAVRDPVTRQLLKPEGEKRRPDAYWRRRLADGDVVKVQANKAGSRRAASKANEE